MNPELVILAEDEHQQLAGLIFCFEDALNPSPKTLVVKTLARHPDRKFAGLGQHLVHMAFARAKQLNFERAIHAFMISGNQSEELSADRFRGEPYKSYSLWGRPLEHHKDDLP